VTVEARRGEEGALLALGAHARRAPTFEVLVIDDHALVRRGLAMAVQEAQPGARVIEASSLAQALDLARRRTGIGLALCDLSLSDAEGIEAVAKMAEVLGDIPLVVISANEDAAMMAACVRAGARGFLPKSGSVDVLVHALPLVLLSRDSNGGYLPLPPQALSGPRDRRPSESLLERLTDRQRDVFRLLLSGQSNKEIARSLGVLEGTVKVHVRAIMQKLGVSSRTQVAIAAAKAGCLEF
jgi:two-component system, NarL family, nitrate/nitrite response regulator NarL